MPLIEAIGEIVKNRISLIGKHFSYGKTAKLLRSPRMEKNNEIVEERNALVEDNDIIVA